jgi:hypothetical protein
MKVEERKKILMRLRVALEKRFASTLLFMHANVF